MIPEVASWWLVSLVLAAAGYPLLSLFSERDVYGLSRAAALVPVTYLVWLMGHAVPVSPTVAAAALLLVAVPAAAVMLRTGRFPDRREVLVTEAFFATFFLFFLVVRLYHPGIMWIGGEKFMDSAFLRAASTSTFPLEDPWMAGATAFYYYAGYLAASVPQLLTGVPWDRAFNLVVPFFAGTAAAAAYGVGRLLRARALPAVALFSGNLASAGLVLATLLPRETVEGAMALLRVERSYEPFSYFAASRVIPGTINEFPFFTLIHADPHPNLYSIPIQILFIGLLALYLRGTRVRREYLLPLLALTLGLFYPLNTWEFPTYGLLTLAALAVAHGGLSSLRGAARGALYGVGTVALSVLLYLPYHLAIETSRGIATVTTRSSLLGFIGANGTLLILVLLYLSQRLSRREFLATLGGVAAFAAVGVPLDFQVLAILPLVPAGLLVLRREQSLPALLLLLGTGIALGVEVLRVEGVYTGALERLNTVFKLYLQLWILWSVPAAAALQPLLTRPVDRRKAAALVMVGGVMFAYPVLGTYDRADEFGGDPTLSGVQYVQDTRPAQYEALQFLDTLEPGVVMEAWGNAYEWNSVAGSLTRHSTVMGWANHEKGWREDDEPIDERIEDIDRVYEFGDTGPLHEYGVDYLYLGPVETRRYPDSWDAFEDEEDLEKLFDNGEVRIYRVT